MYKIIYTQKFEDDLCFYIKKRKYKHIDDDIEDIIHTLTEGNLVGTPIADIEANHKTYKVRAANSDLNVGKSNGYRLIYYAITEDLEIYLLTIYCKKDDIRIPNDTEIKEIIQEYCL